MTSRENMKIMAYGQYVMTNRTDTIDQKNLISFVEGALFVYDLLTKLKNDKAPANNPIQFPPPQEVRKT